MSAVVIRDIAAGGDGVGRLEDGMTVFVPRTVPGDVVEVAVTIRKARYARARPLRVASPGPGRVVPECAHYVRDDCGGCQLQHLSAEAQWAAKRALVTETLRRIGKRSVADLQLVASPQAWRYRTTVTLAIGPGGTIGFHSWQRPDTVFELDDCLIASPRLMELWQRIRPHRRLLPAAATHLVLRESRDGGLHLAVRGGGPPWSARELASAVAEPTLSVWWEPAGGAPRVVWGPRARFPGMAFTQPNVELADRIRRDAVTGLGPVAGKVVWDLYGGVGDAARLLAGAGARVWSVDADGAAVAWAARQTRPVGAPIGSPTHLAGRVEEVVHRLPSPDAVLLNPPRVGVAARVATTLQRLGSEGALDRVAYLSCDPATLARDLARLPAYTLTVLTAYDLFPQTSHVETLAVLERP